MKPNLLIMQAFGPFSGRIEIPFNTITNQTLFLIHGPTGSGKTTILDAICFALYGETSGNERDSSTMRSHHTASTLLTEVTYWSLLVKHLQSITNTGTGTNKTSWNWCYKTTLNSNALENPHRSIRTTRGSCRPLGTVTENRIDTGFKVISSVRFGDYSARTIQKILKCKFTGTPGDSCCSF